MEKGNITAPSTMVYMVENNGIYGTTIFSHDLLPSYSPHGLPIDVNLLCHPSPPPCSSFGHHNSIPGGKSQQHQEGEFL